MYSAGIPDGQGPENNSLSGPDPTSNTSSSLTCRRLPVSSTRLAGLAWSRRMYRTAILVTLSRSPTSAAAWSGLRSRRSGRPDLPGQRVDDERIAESLLATSAASRVDFEPLSTIDERQAEAIECCGEVAVIGRYVLRGAAG